MNQHLAVMRLLDEVVEHLLGDFEVGNYAIFHRLDGDDVARRAAEHLFRLFADGLNFVGVLIERHDRRLVDHDAFATRVHQRVGCSQINSQIAGEKAEQRPQIVTAR